MELTPSSVETYKNHGIAANFTLNSAYPNPFNSGTTLSYSLNSAAFVDLSIYNVNGQLVDQICRENQTSGYHSYKWSPRTTSTSMYFIKLTVDNYTDTKRCICLK
ncbi:MAG TPA: T9SS type A sorting domain-containing protein [bacterium]|nr:T9SS type A sorting domain-containing protein [bacterium]